MLSHTLKSFCGIRKKPNPVVKWTDQSLNLTMPVFRNQATESSKTCQVSYICIKECVKDFLKKHSLGKVGFVC